MSTVQNKIIKRLEAKILKLDKELATARTDKDKLQDKFSNYITNMKRSLEK